MYAPYHPAPGCILPINCPDQAVLLTVVAKRVILAKGFAQTDWKFDVRKFRGCFPTSAGSSPRQKLRRTATNQYIHIAVQSVERAHSRSNFLYLVTTSFWAQYLQHPTKDSIYPQRWFAAHHPNPCWRTPIPANQQRLSCPISLTPRLFEAMIPITLPTLPQ
jgi:hypothetical protein